MDSATFRRVTPALERLEQVFQSELALLCGASAEVCPASLPYATLRGARLDASMADSPSRPIEARHTTANNIDADLDPLLQRNHGRLLADGWTVGGEASVDFVLGSRLGGQAQPRVWVLEGVDGDGGEADATLVRGALHALFGNLAIDVGRQPLLHGSARAYNPVFSANPRASDMIRLGMETPARLPWIFRHLGPSRFALTVSDMGGEREFPHSKLFVYEGWIRPHPNLQLGGAMLNHQMGEGGPEATAWERVRDLLFLDERRFLPFDPIPPISDKVLAGDARLTLPGMGTVVYVEYMTTDDHNLFSSLKTGLGTEAAWTGGFRTMGLGPNGRWDVWAEGGRNGVRPYTHHQYTSGMTLDGRITGSPLGPLATGLTLGLDWTGPTNRMSLAGAWERYQGDTYRDDPSAGTDWIRTADNPDEIRLRATADWTRTSDGATGLRTQVKLGYEHVTRFNFTDQNRNNLLVQVSAGYVWN